MNELTLVSVEETFQEWRAQRYSRSEPIPEALWSMALGLYPEHKRSRICHYLRLNADQFKKRLENNGHTRANIGFVVASREEVKTTAATTNVQLSLQGQARSMTLCFDVHALGQVLAHIDALL